MFEELPESTDVAFLDVQQTIDASSAAPFEHLEHWTVLAVCGNAPAPTAELTSVRAVVAPTNLLDGNEDLGWVSEPLGCPTGWYTTE